MLGPLLFLLYINDFINWSNVFEFHLFADDSNLFIAHKNLKELESIVNDHLCHIQSWLSCNKLSLNIDKTNFVIFHPPQKKFRFQVKLFINHIALKKKVALNTWAFI